MKSKFITLTLATAFLSACGSNSTGKNELTTDSVAFSEKSKTAEVTIKADFPKDGNKTLTNIITEYISEEMGGTYDGKTDNPDSMVAFYCKREMAELEKLASEFETDSEAPLYYSKSVSKIYETDKFVTYASSFESFTGGAHGMHGSANTTFRKSDGRRFGSEMLTRTGTEEFRTLIKDGLNQYFAENEGKDISDEELKEQLITDYSVDFLPLPQFPPYLTEKGVGFTYQPYEIAPYAAGMPSFTIPYEKIKPYMTVTAVKLIENKAGK